MVNEICKSPGSNVAFLHFAFVESASVFFNNYVVKELNLNNVPFTVHPAKFSDGESVIYDYKSLNFGKCVVNSAAVPQFTDTTATTVPV